MVPNKFPLYATNKKIALIGEAPGSDEEAKGEPFVGMSGRFLAALLSQAGVSRDACFLGNVSQVRPPNNDISKWEWQNENIQNGLCQLKKDLAKFEPNIVVLLGNVPLKAAKDAERNHLLKPSLYRFKVGNWRGSLFTSASMMDNSVDGLGSVTKCLSTLHPAYVLRSYDDAPLLQFDLIRAVEESGNPQLILPQRVLATDLTVHEIIFRLANIRELRTPVAIDIEGGVGSLSCISFATSPSRAFIIPFTRKDGTSYWGEGDEQVLWRRLAETLEDPNVPKILQNSLYDRFVLHYSYGIRVQGVTDDTMLRHWSLYAELPKALGVQTSIYTKEPYYKSERKSDGDREFYEYCCKDSAVTIEINNALERYVKEPALSHYRFNIALLNPLLYMELRGIRYDTNSAKARRRALQQKLYEAQANLNSTCGYGFAWTKGLSEVHNQVRELMCYKKDNTTPFAQYKSDYERVYELLQTPSPSLATMGEIESLCDVSMNVGSPMFRSFLYDELQLPRQFKENTHGEQTPTADYEALLRLSKEAAKTDNDFAKRVIALAIEIRALSTRERMLSIHADRDGRIRCGYNIVGSDTGRITCYTSPTGSGYNLQTIPNYTSAPDAPGGVLGDRDLFCADDGYWFAQCDLEGADGWTVAAYSAMLGDPTMLEDYLAGLKPAKILAIKQCNYEADFGNRASLREAAKRVLKDSWEYFACKRIHHGADYLEGKITISKNILKDSEGKLYLSPAECEQLKTFFFQRYWGVKLWHNWVAGQLRNSKGVPTLVAASGQVRKFFGRRDEILTKAVAFEPQANTTFATNLAMYKLWNDNENRTREIPSGIKTARPNVDNQQLHHTRSNQTRLQIEPLHQVHDALCVQFPKADTAWAVSKIRSYFQNPLQIAGRDIIIPFEGHYGRAWGDLNEGSI